ncbi:right-handed parallel beta-helix repeat-containing protein [Streptomyces sp. NBC_01216]|uniref:right-handed parallel beta-helix repeat-containing protein n=1 Tax=Streptomyces sp. NBC_01216 TaxID=2903778 RepID=UPI002E1273C3|nr:right-handed parallel beta-helix repeat-containing protein [Streptomyces sp. NBC_01216]
MVRGHRIAGRRRLPPGWAGAKLFAGVTAGAIAFLCGCDVLKPYTPPRPATKESLTFYLSPDGDDENDGLSEKTAWRTLERADEVPFKPGDRLRLKGGERFTGELTLGEGEAGDAAKPVVIDSYGSGKATVVARGTAGITVHNTGGVEIRNLTISGDGTARRDEDGIKFYNDLTGGKLLTHVRISGVDVSRFRNGISFGAASGSRGFRDITVTDSATHHNQDAGLVTAGPRFDADEPSYAHEKLTVSEVRAYANAGDPEEHERNTGSGIVLGSLKEATVQRSAAYDNGAHSSARADEGPEGIWTYDSTRVVIQNNESYRNRTGSRVDGGGFGLDNNVSESVLQYNLSYGNDGPGFLVYSGEATGAHRDNVVRFNYSWDDARKLPFYGGIVAYGTRLRKLDIYNNTVLQRSPEGTGDGERAPALRLRAGISDIGIRNNIFLTDGAPVVDSDTAFARSRVRLQGNDYHSTGPWNLIWGGTAFSSLAAWRGEAGQEQHDSAPTGTTADPCLVDAAAPVTDRAGAANLVSTCADRLTGAFPLRSVGVDPGPVDYFGERLSTVPSVGAAAPPRSDG